MYNDLSIKWVEQFILDCKKILGDNPFLWFAFQTNALNDLCESSGNFEKHFERMVESLEKDIDFFANLRRLGGFCYLSTGKIGFPGLLEFLYC